MKSRASGRRGRGDAEVAAVRTEREAERLTAQVKVEGRGRQWTGRLLGYGAWGRGGDEPDAGKRSGKNAAFDRPAPGSGKRQQAYDSKKGSRGSENRQRDHSLDRS